MFEALVAEGEKVQERTKTAADERLAEMRAKATRNLGQARAGVRGPGSAGAAQPERAEPARTSMSLTQRVAELTEIAKRLSAEEEPHARRRGHRAKAE